jgi:hypothetical protein
VRQENCLRGPPFVAALGGCGMSSTVLLRFAYLAVTNAFSVLRLLPMSDRDKDVEILVLRHQLTVVQRQLGLSW